MKRIYLLLLLGVLSIAARAQTAASYVFSQTTGTYTNLSSPTTIYAGSYWDDDASGTAPIGFTFNYLGTDYTSVAVNANGYISFSGGASFGYSPFSGGATYTIAGFAQDLYYMSAYAGPISYKTTGTAPNRVFTVEWQNFTRYSAASNGPRNFQIKLYESSMVIDIIYGSHSSTSATTYGYQVGINGASASDYNLRTTTSNWAATTAASSNSSTCSSNNSIYPANGQIFRWTPPPTIIVSPAALTFTQLYSTTSASQNVTVRGYGFSASTVTVTPPVSYFQAYNGTAYVSTAFTIPTSTAAVGSYINTTVPVQFVAPATVGTYTGNITFASTGATTQTVSLTGNSVNPCSGTPVAGTASVTPTVGGTSTPFTLAVGGYTVAGGITFQWQSSATGTAGSWTNISGATTPTYNFTGISANTYYRVNVTCSTSSTTTPTSSILAVYLPDATCGSSGGFYYSPSTTERLNNFSITGYSGSTINDNGPSSHPASGYEDRTGVVAPVDLMQATSYSGSVTYSPADYYYNNQVWIDFNNNGSFETTEQVTPVFGSPGSYMTGASFTLTIPSGANTGYHRMRVRTAMTWSSTLSTGMDPCYYYDLDYWNYYYYGTTRDYIANVVPQPVCSGTPTTGSVLAASTIGCGSITTGLSLSGATSGFSGLTYQWASSPDNSTWTNISGATAATATVTATASTYYRVTMGCTPASTSISSAGVQLTVNPLPAAITGNTLVCASGTTTLASATSGGTWTSSNTAVASINSSTGVATVGSSAGYALISYTLTSTGCRQVTAINVNTLTPTASASASPNVICAGGSTTLNGSTSTTLPTYFIEAIPYAPITQTSPTNLTTSYGGTDDDYGTISLPFSFNFFGTNYTTVYPTTNGYLQFTSPSTNYGGYSLPSASMPYPAISLFHRDLNVISGATIKYSIEGTSPNRKLVINYNNVSDYGSSSGGNTGQVVLSEGTNQIDVYIFSTTYNYHVCAAVQNASASVAYVAPNRNYGYYQVTAPEGWRFRTPTLQYTWSPSATLSATTGTPVSATNVTTTPSVAYTVGVNYLGCVGNATTILTVNPLPNAITGTNQVCEGLTTTLSTTSTGGTWTSSTTSVAAVGSTTGVVSGVVAGTSNVSYTFTGTGCRTTQVVTVNPLPANITGTPAACVGATTNLADATPLGSWSSGTPGVAAIGSTSGVVDGVSAGLAIITYMLPTGCIKTVEATINPLPITSVSPASSVTICAGESANMTANAPLPQFSILSQDFNSGLGLWSIVSPSGVPASNWHITSTPVTGIAGDGTPMLESDAEFATPTETILTSPGFSTLGYGTATLTFNQYLVSIASSDANVDVDYSIDNGATWTNMSSQVGVVSGTGSWTSSSTPEVSVPLPAGALGQANLRLRWHYSSNYGLYWDVDNIKVIAYQPAPTYVWNTTGSATGLACSACATNTITPTATGANVYDITTTTSAGCQSTISATVSVNPLPAAITGSAEVCVNSSITMTNTDPGGSWSSADATVSVASSTGVVTGVTAGPALITYTLPTGCRSTMSIVVNPLPANTTGLQEVCEGLTTTLSNSTSGGTWSSAMSGIASVDASGVVSGIAAGFTDIYYTLTATGCRIAANVTVNPTPAAITGGMQVCEGLTTGLANADAGGTWTSGTTSVATVDPSTGVVSGVSAGASTITYQLPTTCINTAVVTVNPLPAVITGTMQVCEGLTTPLSDATSGGAWSSSATSASVDAAGVVTGITAGVETITYQLPTTCIRTANVTVNPLPAAIAGNLQVCEGLSTGLSNPTTGGTWASGSTGIATIGATTGVANGITAGNSTITYQLPTGCISTADVTVNPLPAAITGIRQVCEGLTTTLANASAGGTWASSAFGVASVDAGGIVSGYSAGVTTITYELPTTCIITADVTVNPLPAAIAGAAQVCAGSSTALVNTTPGGNWSSSNTTAASVNSSGTVFGLAAGATTITYTLPTGCISTHDMIVNPLPAPIVGANQVCEGFTTNLTDITPTGTWSSSNFMVASVDATGIVSGIVAGTATITYQLPTSCMRTIAMVVNPQPAAIAGNMQVCEALTTTLSNTSAGGSWTSSATGTATVGLTSGVVSGISAGNAQITYALPTGCRVSTNVTVNPTPAAIAGTMDVCVNSTTVLTDASAGGTWSSSLPALASVNSSTGAVTGLSMGNVTITYTLPTTCRTTALVTVNPLPAPIAGIGQACEGTTALFTNGSSGGNWTSSTPLVADINTTTGSIDAIAAGTTLVTYTLPTGCLRTRSFVVNPLPAAIAGTAQVCESGNTVLSNATGGGVWSSGAVSSATVNSLGVVSGISAGVAGITYMLPTGCKATTFVTVNQAPSVISGVAAACEGQTTTLSNSLSGGSWTTASSATATADATTGVITGVSAGITAVTYAMPTGCLATRNMVVNTTPAAITGAPQVCQGSNTVMSNTTTGGVWTSSAPGMASVGLTTGMVSGLVPGAVTVSYTLMSGCAAYANIVVNPLPTSVSGATNICNGQTSTLSTATIGGSWVSSDPTIATVTPGGVVTATAPGNATIAYTLSTGCARNAIVTVNANPTVYNITGGGNYCTGGSGVHIGVDGSNTGTNYHLYSGSTPIGIVPGISGLPVDFGSITPAGTYNVIARIAATGCTSNMTGTATVAVNAVVIPDVILSSADVVCDGSLTTFTSVPTNGGTTPSFVWKVNGVTQPGATSATFNYTPANGDVISTSMSSSAACATIATVSDSKTMTVNPNVMPVANVTATPGFVVCDGSTATFTVTNLYGGSSPVYTWLKNGAVAGTGSTFAYAPANGDNIAVKMNSNYSCRLIDEVTSSTIAMVTTPVYVPAITITTNTGTHVNPNTNVTLTANVVSGGPAPVYQWYINSVAIPAATNATFTYSMFNNGDSVSCQVTGTGLCGMSAFNSIIMHVGPTGVAATGVGIADVKLMPNPNKGLFTVKGSLATDTDEEVVMEVTNMIGQVVYRQGVTAKNGLVNEQVQLSNTLANGMYMLNLKTSGDNKVFHFVLEQ